MSDAISELNSADLYCLAHCLLVVPSGYPDNFEAEATSSQSAVISWDPPPTSEQNGVITGYTINVTAVETGEMFQLFSEETSLNVDTLVPFTTYFCVIAASTSIGTGPFSTVFTLRTPEDGIKKGLLHV